MVFLFERVAQFNLEWIFSKLDSGFQSLVGFRILSAGFRIPKPRIPDSRSEKFLDSGIPIPLHGAKWSSFALLYLKLSTDQGPLQKMASAKGVHLTLDVNCVFNAFLCLTTIALNTITIQALRNTSSLPKTLKTLLLSLTVSAWSGCGLTSPTTVRCNSCDEHRKQL